MKIETKLSVGDKAYYLRDNKIKTGVIHMIVIAITEAGRPDIKYRMSEGSNLTDYVAYEHEVFANKQELKDSL